MKFRPVLAALLLGLAALASLPTSPAWAAAPSVDRVVLPTNARPIRYELRVAPDVEHLTFRGHATIEFEVLQPTDRIVLNAADLAFREVGLRGRDETPRIELDDTAQTATFVFGAPLAPGRYVLDVDYLGKIFAQASGLFALDAHGAKGRERYLFTQFENSDARRFAPMWDEPAAKAVFSLTVEAPAGQMAVSNMPVARTAALGGGRTAVTFADTPKMSSYLLFLALGDFERVSRKVGGVDIGVVVRRGAGGEASFALDAASELLGYYNDYFGAPYPLPKLDFVAGPGQSQFFGAMENWGAIFAFDRDLLVDPGAAAADRQSVYTVVAHEMAHQWFGDLVTMAWWDDLWLNEGFASWMETKATDHFHPEWKTSLQAMAGRERAMQLDAGAEAHPVITPIRDVFAASGAFDEITYQKGQAVIRMLERYVGEEAFRGGIRAYIARYAYANTTTDQLWAELERVSPRPVTQIAHDFTLQAGAPLIRADPARGGVRLSLTGFSAAPPERPLPNWLTPVRVAPLEGKPSWTGLVQRGRGVVAGVQARSPLIVNAGQAGYFRTAYATELRRPLIARYLELAPEDQIGLLYDSRALLQTSRAPAAEFLEIASLATRSSEPIVLSALVSELTGMERAYPESRGEAFRAFARARLTPILARVGWEARADEDANMPGLRAELISALGQLDDAATVAEARRRFRAALAAQQELPAELRYGVQAVVARHATPGDWQALLALAKSAASTREQNRLYALLGSAQDKALAGRALELALSGEPPATTAPAIVASVGVRNPEMAFDFAVGHRAQVDALLEPTSRTIFFANLASTSSEPGLIRRLQEFARTVPASSRGEVDQAIAAIDRRRSFAERKLPEIDRWLAAHPG